MKVGGHMASAKREPIMEVWGQSPQRSPGAGPLVGESGGVCPLPEAESLVACGRLVETAKLPNSHVYLKAESTRIWLAVKRATFCGISVYPPVCNTRIPCPND